MITKWKVKTCIATCKTLMFCDVWFDVSISFFFFIHSNESLWMLNLRGRTIIESEFVREWHLCSTKWWCLLSNNSPCAATHQSHVSLYTGNNKYTVTCTESSYFPVPSLLAMFPVVWDHALYTKMYHPYNKHTKSMKYRTPPAIFSLPSIMQLKSRKHMNIKMNNV